MKTDTKEVIKKYWNRHNVTDHQLFGSVEDSVDAMVWRDHCYLYYKDLMPTNKADGKVVLDYGCGPGHDLVGFSINSNPKRLIAMDVSAQSIKEAKSRLMLHQQQVEFSEIDASSTHIPLEDNSVDLIHCSGVLHHTLNPKEILKEFRRILKKDGEIQIMVYNYESIWVHLYVAYEVMLKGGSIKDMLLRKLLLKRPPRNMEEAFQATTDGASCPVSRYYLKEDFLSMLQEVGLKGHYKGASVSMWMEMNRLSKRFEAILDKRLDNFSRSFLYNLTFDERGAPLYKGHVAGIGGCYSAQYD